MRLPSFRTAVAVALATAMLATPVAAAPITNYVENPGFEEFEDDDPAQWRVLSGEVNPTDDATEGEQAALLTLTGDTTETTVAQNVTEEPQDVIVPGYEYDFAFDAKFRTGAENDATNETNATGVVLWKNAAGEVVDRDTITIESGDYRSYNETFRAPLDATDAEVRFTLARETPSDRTDANLKVDAVAFGPSDGGTGLTA